MRNLMAASGPFMTQEHLSLQSTRKALEALIAGERRNQLYFLLTSVVGLFVGVGLLWWTVVADLGTASTRVAGGAIPIITSGLSVTRIAVCESKIAQYKAASALTGPGVAVAIKLIETTLLRGIHHGSRSKA
jgi:hypothetical protein